MNLISSEVQKAVNDGLDGGAGQGETGADPVVALWRGAESSGFLNLLQMEGPAPANFTCKAVADAVEAAVGAWVLAGDRWTLDLIDLYPVAVYLGLGGTSCFAF